MPRRMRTDLDARLPAQGLQLLGRHQGARIVISDGLRACRAGREPRRVLSRLPRLDRRFTFARREIVEPQQAAVLHRIGAGEGDRRQPVGRENRRADREHAAVAIVEGHQHGSRRQRRRSRHRRAPIVERDGVARVADNAAVALERRRPHVQVLERHRPVRPVISAQTVIPEHDDARKSQAAKRAAIVAGCEQPLLEGTRDRGIHDNGFRATKYTCCSRRRTRPGWRCPDAPRTAITLKPAHRSWSTVRPGGAQ